MSASKNPPAFPHGPYGHLDPGMSLRDWFAGHALQAIMLAAGIQSVLKQEQFLAEPICADAYKFADAMLAERERQS